MPSLAHTQLPFLRRDIECGLVPLKHLSESVHAYHVRIASLYGLTVQQIADELND